MSEFQKAARLRLAREGRNKPEPKKPKPAPRQTATGFQAAAQKRLANERQSGAYDQTQGHGRRAEPKSKPKPEQTRLEQLRQNYVTCHPKSPEFSRAKSLYFREKHAHERSTERSIGGINS
jgi:hypothetical protein